MPTLFKLFTIVVSLAAALLNIYIYTYPSLNSQQCSWNADAERSYLEDLYAQFFQPPQSNPADIHLLAFGDPQIKGVFPSTKYITRLDTFGNDFYLGHIYRMMVSRLKPTHAVVMGDLFSSQWIADSNFFDRTKRYIDRIFTQPEPEVASIKKFMDENEKVDWVEYADNFVAGKDREYDFYNTRHWSDIISEAPLLINLTGNHDIGYSGDVTYQHMCRFKKIFGRDNYFIEYDGDEVRGPWRIVVLNSMFLEGPALQPEFVEDTWDFLYELFARQFSGSTILLTHVPFYKEAGLCTDGPEFRYYPQDYEKEPYKRGLLRSHNHLSEETTQRALNLIFSNDKPGIILTGHDHYGCETMYSRDVKNYWTAAKNATEEYSIREVTVKSMMGEYDGNTGIVTGQYNDKKDQWEFHYTLCPFIVQHVWWVTKVVSIIAGLAVSANLVMWAAI